MPTPFILALDSTLPPALQVQAREFAARVASQLGDIVLLASLPRETLDDLRAWAFRQTAGKGLEGIEPGASSVVAVEPMPFVRRDDGRPDWTAMTRELGLLALYGGVPERAAAYAIVAPDPEGDTMVLGESIMEMRRALFETTGLYSELLPPCWLAVSCRSRRMAAWLTAAVILENIDARCEEEILYVPASSDFQLEDQVRGVVSAVAKACAYWQTRVEQQPALESTAG